ncbi:RNA polymerase sigma factor RpoE [Lentimonas sp. CC4]|uniref:RNA polymerase sigma factor n=2 Tax=Lentimonas TaxID=417293 RepID=UPI0013236CA2|nr:sigma-70 family RNA polymerase sigma factor [Lentimonas sp. CC8]CAA6676872.1 RNA polymerase sigma factor RpoE [Lentimonas sp. CC4]CAA6686679.1 RNA polymerase sigma factor RpoE [Lentimonas sp. CC6]CAA7168097.1 RNA polymerase sigma factor RpoE [Lentimonas sp. CC21]CAA7075744.1 RNA polymerase sigma factor RpoE [Lentimonas sp. CC4]CAA7181755.1 RNA polymerase sigma factor RpoE [Lentimonas sp. CC8]
MNPTMRVKSEPACQDDLLIERIKNGDNAAYEDMVTRYWDRIFARVHHLLKNQQDAEEVTQDAFIRAHRGLESFRGDASFSTWLYQIATNLAHNRYWYWFRRKRDYSVSLDQPLSAEGDLTLENVMPSESETPAESAVTQEFVDRVSECMNGLGDKHREVLTLRNVQNMSYEEISQELDISVGTVKSRIARARESLRELMGSDFS